MALDVEHGVFTKQAGTGNQTVTLADSGLTPKFIIFHGDGYHTADGIVNDYYGPFRGWTSASESASWSCSVQSNNKNGQAGLSNGCILILDEDSNTEAKATIVSMSAGSFVINWGTNANTTACRIFYTAIGGADLNEIQIGAGALNTSTGNQSFSSITTAAAKIGFFAVVHGLTSFPTDSVGNTGTGLGMAVSSSKRYMVAHGIKGDKGREVFDDTKCIGTPGNSDTVIDLEADFVSFDTTGFTINITNAPTGAFQLVYVLLGGTNLNVDAGSFTSPTSTGTDAVTTTHEPAIVGLETGLTEVGDVYGDKVLQLSYGVGTSSTARANHTWANPDNKTPESANNDSFVIQGYIAAATLTASTEDADIDSFAATSFTLDWTKVSSTAYEYGWFTIGGTAVGAPTGTGTITLGTLSTVAQGEQPHEGTGALVTESSLVSATGEQPHEGAGVLVLDDALLAGSGIQEIPGAGAVLLDDAVIAAIGEQPHEGTGALVLDDALLDASGVQVYAATGALDLAQSVLAASATALEGTEGTATVLLADALLDATGQAPYVGTTTVLLAESVLDASAVQVYAGAGVLDFSQAVLAASATALEGAEGTATMLLADALLDASGVQIYAATGALDLAQSVLAASGTALESAEGTATVLLEQALLDGTGQAPYVGTGAVLLADAVLDASAAQVYAGAGVLALAQTALAASAIQVYPGTGTLALNQSLVVASGEQPHEGAGVLSLDNTLLAAIGEGPFVGAGDLVLDGASLDAAGEQTLAGSAVIDLEQAILSGIAIKFTGALGDIADPSMIDLTAPQAMNLAHTYDLADVSDERSMRAGMIDLTAPQAMNLAHTYDLADVSDERSMRAA